MRGPLGQGVLQPGPGQSWHCKGPWPPPVAPCCALLSALPRATREQKASSAQEGLPPRPRCVRCCEPPDQRFSYPQYQPLPQINMTILKGEGWQDPMLRRCPQPNLRPRYPMLLGTTSLPGLPASPQGQRKARLPVPALWDASLTQTARSQSWCLRSSTLHRQGGGGQETFLGRSCFCSGGLWAAALEAESEPREGAGAGGIPCCLHPFLSGRGASRALDLEVAPAPYSTTILPALPR